MRCYAVIRDRFEEYEDEEREGKVAFEIGGNEERAEDNFLEKRMRSDQQRYSAIRDITSQLGFVNKLSRNSSI